MLFMRKYGALLRNLLQTVENVFHVKTYESMWASLVKMVFFMITS